ncbi:MAG: serine/threonine protein kinase [Acidobacteria bacterium]|nr:serine/threonine protein kinase [Acidobacteriota bacterium]
MGVVYRAEDTLLGRSVAIKLLSPHLTRDDEAKLRFLHEARAASALDHPNICTIHEINETPDGQLFLVMACYEGETLARHLAGGRLSVQDAVDLAAQAAQGLARAHAAGVIHRDVKPANLFVTTEGLVKILDFGIAKLMDQTRVTKTGETVGTISYMSPEHLTGEEITASSDVWSLGVVLYEMLAGHHPFGGAHEVAVIDSIRRGEPTPLPSIRDDVPHELERIVVRTLQKKPQDRYQKADELAQDLINLKRSMASSPGPTRTLSVTLKKPAIVIPHCSRCDCGNGCCCCAAKA